MMNEPIPIIREKTEELLTEEERQELDRKRNGQVVGWVLVGLIVVVVLALVIPLSVWLTRLALGG